MPRKKSHKFELKTVPNTALKILCQENKYAYFQAKKAHNTTLQTFWEEKKIHKFEPKKHLALLYKNYTKKNKCTNSS